MPSPRTMPSRTSIVAFVLLLSPVLYVLSYAPVVRACDGPDSKGRWDVYEIPPKHHPYKPVDWLIDNTPLRKPLLFWADVWGVRDTFEYKQMFRDFN